MQPKSDDKFSLVEDPHKEETIPRGRSRMLYVVPALLLLIMLFTMPFIWHNYYSRNHDRFIVLREFETFAYGKPREEKHTTNWFVAIFQIRWSHDKESVNAQEPKPAEMAEPIADLSNTTHPTIISNQKEPKVRVKRATSEAEKCSISDDDRFDCHPEPYATEQKCASRGCCWSQPKSSTGAPRMDVPGCFYPQDYLSYEMVNQTESTTGSTAFLRLVGKPYYPNPVHLLQVDVTFLSDKQVNVKIYDPDNPRFEVPYITNKNNERINVKEADFEFSFASPLKIVITQKSTGLKVFENYGGFIYTDQFIQISQPLPSQYIYGLGERRDNFLANINWQRFTMFAADQSPRDNSNLYGSHPFHIALTQKGESAIGQLLLNSNAMEVVLQPSPAITYRTLGGILDFHIFVGDNPNEVVSEYIKFIGLPTLPPYWSLGFHLSRWGYQSSKVTRETWQAMRDAEIPFDVQWNDIDYMDNQRDFTYDKKNFADLPALVKDIHDAGMHYVVIVDPGIDPNSVNNSYPPYDDGVKQDIFIKNYKGDIFYGKVWSPYGAVYPDFTNPKTTVYWTEQLQKFHNEIPYDGLWIDMNEPSNFMNGEKDGCPDLPYEKPPYIPDVNGGILQHKTLCMTAKQHLSDHYNVHNLYGLTEAIATNAALKTITKKRPFIISRSSFVGHGHYAGHWSGDNFATWSDMKRSIPAMLDFNIFGIPLMGADICGFNDNTEEQLCKRWMELGAFYPFSRNHNTEKTIPQDPVSMGKEVEAASRVALTYRYLFLPYLNTLFYRASKYGETVARPLVLEFPKDSATYGIDTQFLWGSSLMILPVLEKDITQFSPYFPKGKWYLRNFKTIDSTGETFDLGANLEIAYRGGSIVPIQKVAQTTTESRKEHFGLVVALDEEEEAKGELFWDDGDSLDVIETGTYNLLNFTATKGKLESNVVNWGAKDEKMTVGAFFMVGVQNAPDGVKINGQAEKFEYSYELKMISCILNDGISFNQMITVEWQ